MTIDAYLSDAVRTEIEQKFGAKLLEFKQFTTGPGLSGYVIDRKPGAILVANPHPWEGAALAEFEKVRDYVLTK